MKILESLERDGRRFHFIGVIFVSAILALSMGAAEAQARPAKGKKKKAAKAAVVSEAARPAKEEAAEEAPAPAVPAGDCAKCHKKIFGRKFAHGPVGVGMCSVCHVKEVTKGKHHTYTGAKEQPELCLSCHEAMRKKVEDRKVPHPAIAAGGCTACHDPHGSEDRFFLKSTNMDKVCSSCHDPKTKGAVVHPPVAQSCSLCHEPHGSDNAKLLKAPPPGLCLDCHEKARAEFSGKHVHPPVKTGCASCHDMHSAPKPFLLQGEVKDVCLKCHGKIAQKLKKSKMVHPAVETAGCTGCHGPHTEAQDKLLRKPMKELCSGCHKEKAAELKSKFLHGPVAQDECQGCHDPHAADNPKILNTFFPQPFYNQYKDGLYSLCFNCHEKDIARDKKTTTLTDFRNGDLNLHYLHVHSEKGRSCKACHQVHGGGQEKHIRDGVPFGSWVLPITFKKTPKGGSCNVGCHNPKSYSRSKAVVNP